MRMVLLYFELSGRCPDILKKNNTECSIKSSEVGESTCIFQQLIVSKRCISCRSKPLQIWDKQVKNGHIKRITDEDIQSSVLEIIGTNVSTAYLKCPQQDSKTLGIKLPFLVMIIKNVSSCEPSAVAVV